MSNESTDPNNGNWLLSAIIIMTILSVPAYLLWREWVRFEECRMTGHSLLYCVLSVMS